MHACRLATLGLVLVSLIAAVTAARPDTGPAPIRIGATERPVLHHTVPPRSTGPQSGENDIAFADANHGLLAIGTGAEGLVQRTDDGGVTWRTVWRRRGMSVTWVGFVDGRHAFAAAFGSAPLLLRSTDGGRSWRASAVSLPGRHDPFFFWGNLSFQFVTTRVGFGIAYPYGTGDGKPIIRTDDGGRHWRALRTPFSPSGVTFVTPRLGYATGVTSRRRCFDDLFETTDGGASWHGIEQTCRTEDLWGIDVLDRNHVYVAGGAGYWTEAPRQSLLATTNGGRTWRTVYDHTESAQAGGLPFVAVRFVDRAHGWALTGSCKQGANGPCPGDVFITSDDGRHWLDTGQEAVRLATAGADSAWTTGGEFVSAVFRTTDGGTSWRPLVRPEGVDVQALAAGGSQLLGQSGAGPIASEDYGRTWQRFDVDLPGWEYGQIKPALVAELTVTPTRNFGGLRLSGDRGRSWTPKYMLHRGQTVVAIAFADTNHGFVATTGDCGTTHRSQLRVTSDGGRRWGWARAPFDAVAALAAAPGLLVALGYFECPGVGVSRDGGRTWRIDNFASDSYCIGAVALARSTILVACDQLLLRSTNSGISWTSLKTGLDVRDLASTADGAVWLVGQSTLWRSDDGGRTWLEHWIRLPTS